jgi:glyoxylase-like metal-dependent hydrolase (beta-lactamase superfamily II)
MKIADKIFFYEGDYISKNRIIYAGLGSSNFLVIEGAEQAMIDSGMPGGPHFNRISKELKHDGIDLNNTSRVILSHTHPDHFLHAKKISRKNSVNFTVHHDSEPMARRSSYQFEACYNFPSFIQKEIFNCPVWIAKLVMNRYFGFDYLRIQHLLANDEKINLGVPAEVIHLPSHFPGHIGLYFPDSKILYSADLFDFRVSEGGIINNALSSYEEVFRDIDKVRNLEVEIIIPGHGRIIKGRSLVKTTIDRLQKGTESYAEDVLRFLRGSTGSGVTLTNLAYSIFSGMNTYNLIARKVIIYNTLMHLRSRGITVFRVVSDRAHWRLN